MEQIGLASILLLVILLVIWAVTHRTPERHERQAIAQGWQSLFNMVGNRMGGIEAELNKAIAGGQANAEVLDVNMEFLIASLDALQNARRDSELELGAFKSDLAKLYWARWGEVDLAFRVADHVWTERRDVLATIQAWREMSPLWNAFNDDVDRGLFR